jgi:short-subunit dehydrogenase
MRRIVIIGATSSIAKHCARLWARQPTNFILVGRKLNRLERVANDLKIRSQESNIEILICDFSDPVRISETVDAIAAGGLADIVLIAHGMLPPQADCSEDLKLCKEVMEINGISPALFAERFARHMETTDHGVLAIIGSVAGDRGRKSNYTYGAAKGLLERYAQGLQHRLAKTNAKVVLIKPGPTETPMTATIAAQNCRMASVETVAADILRATSSGAQSVYVPGKWRLIMLVVRHIPTAIFNRLNI